MTDSHRESMKLTRPQEQVDIRPLPHNELIRLLCFAPQAWVAAEMWTAPA
jgi:hypothetical protein